MSFNKKDNKNLLLNQIMVDENENFIIKENVPAFSNEDEDIKLLTYHKEINWSSIKGSEKIIITNSSTGDILIDVSLGDPFQDTEVFFRDGQIGVGRLPLHSYKVDIAVPVNTRMTALHIGDGRFGMSLGNATDEGFLPQIIGMGSDSDDAGLYLLGKVSVDIPSNIPAIIFDGRAIDNSPMTNRPIFGITSGTYSDFKFLIDQYGNVGIGDSPGIYKLNVDGVLRAKNIIVDSSTEILDLKQEIENLRNRLSILEQK
jgi:hypothetical protein